MKKIEMIAQKLKSVCGLDVTSCDIPLATNGGVYVDVAENRTVFCVTHDGKTYAFAIVGCGDEQRVMAALAREYAANIVSSASAQDNVRNFLNGVGEPPLGVHVGKSDYYVYAVYGKATPKNIREYLTTMACVDDIVAEMSDDITAFCKKVDDDIYYRSAGELAYVLKENLSEEIKGVIKIGIGGVAHGVFELPEFFAYAKSALVSGAEFDPNSDVYSYKEYALIKALSSLSRAGMENYLETVLDKNYRDILADEELTTAADAFIKHSLNISEGARSMYMHRNTLIYRLDKIENGTGLNIRNFNDAMTFRIATLIYKML